MCAVALGLCSGLAVPSFFVCKEEPQASVCVHAQCTCATDPVNTSGAPSAVPQGCVASEL